MKLLQVDFEFNGPFGEEMSNALVDLAKSINNEPGMIWKIWTENEAEKLGGGGLLVRRPIECRSLSSHAQCSFKRDGRSGSAWRDF